jgi:hypothetical protein
MRFRGLGPALAATLALALLAPLPPGPALPAASAADALARGFTQPPDSTKPWCYWYWITDNISREGITRDLEAMARVGIGEAFIGNIYLEDVRRGSVPALTEEWWGLVEHAIREGGRLGVDIGLFNCPGWSQSGGPWVRAEQAMRYLVCHERRVRGPARLEEKLPAPKEPFQDVAILAFPAPRQDTDSVAGRTPQVRCAPAAEGADQMFDGNLQTVFSLPPGAAQGEVPFTIDIAVQEPFTARSLVLHPAAGAFAVECELQVAAEAGVLRRVRSFLVDRSNLEVNVGPMPFGPVAISFPAQTGRAFRLVLTRLKGRGGFAEVELSGAARLERFVEKQLAKMHPTPQPMWDTYLWPPAAEPETPEFAVSPAQVVDLRDRLSPDGALRWDVPEGQWIVTRIGMTPTGTKNSPASSEAQGLEIDKMSRAAAAAHFAAYIGKLLARLPAKDRRAFRHVVADSYEMGSENWTDGFDQRFRARYGYDARRWLPALTGRLVGSAEQSDRFLWDLRRLVADRVALDYVGALRELCHRHGLKLWLENYGHWGFPAEFLQYGGQADHLGGEFWATGELGSIELRAAASAAHIYGRPIISAEAFTGGPLFRSTPWALKRRGDWAATEGINHFVLHVYIHQPDERRPGVNAWFGTEFNRHNTWFEQSRSWVDYLRRSHFLLQQGRPVADVAYFIGEDTPKMTGVRRPELPPGYDFDYINAEVIEQQLKVKQGRWMLPHGASYRLLVLPELATMRPELLRKLRDLIAEGGAILGSPPERSPSLENYPACDALVQQLAAELWQHCDGRTVREARFHQGRVLRGLDLAAALTKLDTPPDVAGLDPQKVLWTHRSTGEADIYFLASQSEQPMSLAPVFRVRGKAPELWRPDTGRRVPTAVFATVAGGIRLPLHLEARGSVFVLFRKSLSGGPTVTKVVRNGELVLSAAEGYSATGRRPGLPPLWVERAAEGSVEATLFEGGAYGFAFSDGQTRTCDAGAIPAPIELAGPWELRFPKNMDVPERLVLDRLVSWSDQPEEPVQYFSGTASYGREFEAPTPTGELLLDLGRVEALAEVLVNGENLGVLWKPPFRVSLTRAVKPGRNRLEVRVTNVWLNRLLGDKKHPHGFPGGGALQFKPYLAADISRQIGEAAAPSGLLGPVRLIAGRRVHVECQPKK